MDEEIQLSQIKQEITILTDAQDICCCKDIDS